MSRAPGYGVFPGPCAILPGPVGNDGHGGGGGGGVGGGSWEMLLRCARAGVRSSRLRGGWGMVLQKFEFVGEGRGIGDCECRVHDRRHAIRR